jgi:GxxExxY protein
MLAIMKTREELDELSRIIFNASVSVHKEMRPGLLESVYQMCLVEEFLMREIQLQTFVPIPLVYKGKILNKDYVIDILVEGDIILELKAIEAILPSTRHN